MYWYKPKLLIAAGFGLFLMSGLQSCKPDIKENRASMKYFDIKGFFKSDSARLTKLNPLIFKTVKHNGVIESKTVHITNWGTELGLFSGSDINKPAWRDSYKVTADSNIIIYEALKPELNTREVLIKLVAGKVKYMMIINATDKHSIKNLLYNFIEKLSYFPDSLYLIQRSQTVRFLGTNKYDISGFFTHR
jgi:hypothetical protein